MTNSGLAVTTFDKTLSPQAELLAENLKLPVVTGEADYSCLLVVTDKRLEIRLTGKDRPGPVYAEFVGGTAGYRRKKGGGRKQHIARAVGIKDSYLPRVIDATAGLGSDGFVLATLGCEVEMMERSPIIAALLKDGLRRAFIARETSEIVSRLTVTTGNSIELLKKRRGKESPDVVYLDPMYPQRSKQAMNKKEMQMLKEIVGNDADCPLLLKAALISAAKRVVVKRPRTAPAIMGPEPDYAVTGKSSRFDVYLL